jgi:hypothetical protein
MHKLVLHITILVSLLLTIVIGPSYAYGVEQKAKASQTTEQKKKESEKESFVQLQVYHAPVNNVVVDFEIAFLYQVYVLPSVQIEVLPLTKDTDFISLDIQKTLAQHSISPQAP